MSASVSVASHHMLIGVYKRLARLNFSSLRCEDSIGSDEDPHGAAYIYRCDADDYRPGAFQRCALLKAHLFLHSFPAACPVQTLRRKPAYDKAPRT
jgi:hypothetical protein